MGPAKQQQQQQQQLHLHHNQQNRARSGFNIYKSAVYQQIKEANPTFHLGQIATETTIMWQALSETERTQYSDEHNPSIIPQSIRAHLATSNPTTASSRCCAACTTLQTNDHPLSRCKCHSVYYCNATCQRAHWGPHQDEHRRLVKEKKAKATKADKNASENDKKETPTTTNAPPPPPPPPTPLQTFQVELYNKVSANAFQVFPTLWQNKPGTWRSCTVWQHKTNQQCKSLIFFKFFRVLAFVCLVWCLRLCSSWLFSNLFRSSRCFVLWWC